MTHPHDAGPALKPSDEARRLVEHYAELFCELGPSNECCGKLTDDECSGCLARAYIARLEATPQNAGEAKPVGWREDPSADEDWNAGCQFAQDQLCKVLGVDPHSIDWDAATETLDGDVQSVTCKILTAGLGDDWQDIPKINAMLDEGQGDDDGAQILPDFSPDMSLYAKVEACLFLLEKRRDVIEAYAAPPHADLVAEIVRAWEALPSGNYSPRTVERWLVDSMKPAMDRARAALTNGGKNVGG